MIVASGSPIHLGVSAEEATLEVVESAKPEGSWAGNRRLMLKGEPAFELSFWCGTCPALFERLEGATQTVSLESASSKLADGIDTLDPEVIKLYGGLLAAGPYLPILQEVQPRLVFPGLDGDYFAHEQVSTWGVNGFWGLPENPSTPYYRTFETAVTPAAHLYEVIVPMVPPSWNDRDRVERFEEQLTESPAPTAVALSVLDVCAPAVDAPQDYYEHWLLMHFLLDGHHKVQAAANLQRPVRMLSLVSVEGSLAKAENVAKLTEILQRPAARRPGLA